VSFADLTPDAYKAAEMAARRVVKRFGELDLEYDEVYHEGLIYLAERPHIVTRSHESGFPIRQMERLIRDFLAYRMHRESERQGASESYEEWRDWYVEEVDQALVDG